MGVKKVRRYKLNIRCLRKCQSEKLVDLQRLGNVWRNAQVKRYGKNKNFFTSQRNDSTLWLLSM
ncbi:hypothetical protein Syun_011925 [Stephania yunnanensis]|uniref:Uncharacterized protein n=1 Tax=Stephania yunnanensis TaxID=152371 RepID=A0AAP0PIJ4_9MAGN